jgi:hypothetical protein
MNNLQKHNYHNSHNTNALILCFSAIIWKRIFSCLFVYAKYKNIPLSTTDLLKCLKYNLLAPTGLVQKLRPYLLKALTDGFLMPQDSEKDPYVKKAISLFGEAYKVALKEDKKQETHFIHKYASNIFSDEDYSIAQNEVEAVDLIKDIYSNIPKDIYSNIPKDIYSNIPKDIYSNIPKDIYSNIDEDVYIKYCELIDAWDVDLSLAYSDDPYFNLLKISLLSAINSN